MFYWTFQRCFYRWLYEMLKVISTKFLQVHWILTALNKSVYSRPSCCLNCYEVGHAPFHTQWKNNSKLPRNRLVNICDEQYAIEVAQTFILIFLIISLILQLDLFVGRVVNVSDYLTWGHMFDSRHLWIGKFSNYIRKRIHPEPWGKLRGHMTEK